LNHAYSWERVESLLVFALAIPRSSLEWLD
jgi:hypothetical protein